MAGACAICKGFMRSCPWMDELATCQHEALDIFADVTGMEALKQGIGRFFHRRGRSLTVRELLPERAPVAPTTPPSAHSRRNTCTVPFASAYIATREPYTVLSNHKRRNTSALPPACVRGHPAFKALYPNQAVFGAHRRERSKDLQEWTRSNEAGLRLHSEDVADRNLRWEERWYRRRAQDGGVVHTIGGRIRDVQAKVTPSDHRDWPFPRGLEDRLSPVKSTSKAVRNQSVGSPVILSWEDRPKSLARKRNVFDLRDASDVRHERSRSVPFDRLNYLHQLPVKTGERDKSLPLQPFDRPNEYNESGAVTDRTVDRIISDLTENVQPPIDWPASIAASPDTTTTVCEQWMPSVTHETITRNVHEIREEHISHEVHKHHFYHRILPITDLEVLPTRHFLEVEGGYMEISEDEVPVEQRPDPSWLASEIESRLLSSQVEDNDVLSNPLEPHSQEVLWEGFDCFTSDGAECTESTIKHSPIIKPAVFGTGDAYAAYFSPGDCTHDGAPTLSSLESPPQSDSQAAKERWPFANDSIELHPAIPPRKMQPLYITHPWSFLGKHHGLF